MKKRIFIDGHPSIDKPWLKYYSNNIHEQSIPSTTIYEQLKDNVIDENLIALEYIKTKISFKELMYSIDNVASSLKHYGVNKDDIVSVCLPNIPEAVYLFYAINKIGAISNMLDVRASEKELMSAIIQSNSKTIFCLDSVAEKFKNINQDNTNIFSISPIESLPKLVKIIAKINDPQLRVKNKLKKWSDFCEVANRFKDSILSEKASEDIATIAYTGGTTGQPKGVVATNRNVNSVAYMEKNMDFNFEISDRLLNIAPPWTYYGLCNSLHAPLCMGITSILIPKLGADELGKAIDEYKPNHIITIPSALNTLIDYRFKTTPSFLKSIIVGADKLDEQTEIKVNNYLQECGANIVIDKGYGMTESMAACCVTFPGCNSIGSVGVPYPLINISTFVESNGDYKECKVGEQGEICISGPTVMKSYFLDVVQTNEMIKTHSNGEKWLHTGDIGYISEDDYRLYILGRIKRMFVRNGYKIFPSIIEQSIMKNKKVRNCAVVNINDKTYGNLIVAYIIKNNEEDNEKFIKENIIEELKKEVYEYQIPDKVVFVNSFPLTPMGKVDYKKLEEMHLEHE